MSGNLDRRGIGDIKTLTVREYFTPETFVIVCATGSIAIRW